MTVCYFGIYNPSYSRNHVIIKGLKKRGVKVVECRTQLKGIKKYFALIKKHRLVRGQYQTMIVGFPGYQSVILAKMLTRKKIIFDAFTSFYEATVLDRKASSKYSFRAIYSWALDWLSCRLADKVLLDTESHIRYFIKEFGLRRNKFIRVFVGSDDDLFGLAKRREKNNFLVHFHGSYIPLQGVEYVIEAARLLKKEAIEFNIIGTNIKKKYGDLDLPKVNFLDDVPYRLLGEYIFQANIGLGIFGGTAKAKRVIPNKAYEVLASGVALITGCSEAAKELLIDRENVLFCRLADGKDLARKIAELKNHSALRQKIAHQGQLLFRKRLTPQKVVNKILPVLSDE